MPLRQIKLYVVTLLFMANYSTQIGRLNLQIFLLMRPLMPMRYILFDLNLFGLYGWFIVQFYREMAVQLTVLYHQPLNQFRLLAPIVWLVLIVMAINEVYFLHLEYFLVGIN